MVNSNVRELIKLVSKYKIDLLVSLISLTSVSCALLTIGSVFRNLIDSGIVSGEKAQIHNSIYLVSGLIVIVAISSFFRSYFINLIALKITSDLRSQTYKSLFAMDIPTAEEQKIADIISRFSEDIENISKIIVNFLSLFIRNIVTLSGALILMLMQSTKLTLLIMMAIPILLIPLLKLAKHVRILARKTLQKKLELSSDVEEHFTAIRTLYAYNQQSFIKEIFEKKLLSYNRCANKRLQLRSLFFAMSIILVSGTITLIIWIGTLDIITGSMSSGEMISFIYYAVMLGLSSGGIAELFSELQTSVESINRVSELKNIVSRNSKNIIDESPRINGHSIHFNNVSFSYPSRDIIILNDISFNIKAGEFIGIVGRSGSGKTSIMQLLLKFYTHYSGDIIVGDSNIKNTSDENLRSLFGYVGQETNIFSDTIRANILFGKVGSEKLEEVAEICGVLDFARNMKHGLDSKIGQKGSQISGGQKQKIALARALLFNPKILLLDEATSAIDSESEIKILENIKSYLQNRTIISIAHRISSVEKSDRILVIDKGSITHEGNHKILLKSSIIYKSLYDSLR